MYICKRVERIKSLKRRSLIYITCIYLHYISNVQSQVGGGGVTLMGQ